ncbi:SdpI family protein [Prescottella subtropica]|uniref:SdpI family protein n=1 Tax=Prescottella subtropica TaxID=2545757 RepID=UPI0010F509F4|nr:SdpI family protein [Prescottella subtropica]
MESIGLRIVLCLTFTIGGALIVWALRSAASGRLRRNHYVGIRTATTMASDEAWTVAHRAGRPLTETGGWLMIVAGLAALVPMPESALTTVTVAGVVALGGFTGAGAWVGIRAARALPGDEAGNPDA